MTLSPPSRLDAGEPGSLRQRAPVRRKRRSAPSSTSAVKTDVAKAPVSTLMRLDLTWARERCIAMHDEFLVLRQKRKNSSRLIRDRLRLWRSSGTPGRDRHGRRNGRRCRRQLRSLQKGARVSGMRSKALRAASNPARALPRSIDAITMQRLELAVSPPALEQRLGLEKLSAARLRDRREARKRAPPRRRL